MTIELRLAEARDKPRCLELVAALAQRSEPEPGWGATYDELLRRERGEILVADDDGVLLGVATVSYNLAIRYRGEYCQLEELIVDPDARGRNVGGLLVQETLARARERGCAEYGLYLVERTERNRPFYEKYGLEVVGSEMRLALR